MGQRNSGHRTSAPAYDRRSFDVTVTGFEIAEIDLILKEAESEPDKEDSFEASLDGPSVSQAADLWLMGKHRVLCGSALDQNALTSLLSGRRANVVFVDPPYNVAIDGHATGNGAIHHREFAMASGEMSEAEFLRFLEASLSLLAKHSAEGSVHFVCMDWRHMKKVAVDGEKVYGKLLNLCVWAKDNGGMGSFYRSQHELVFVFRNGGSSHRNNIQLGRYGRNRTNVWRYPGVNTFSKQGEEGNLLALHSTVKPVALVADAQLDCSARGEVVLDTFLGSGTTLIAAERVGRVCYGLELDSGYVDTAIRRWQEYTGDMAILAASGLTFQELSQGTEVSHG